MKTRIMLALLFICSLSQNERIFGKEKYIDTLLSANRTNALLILHPNPGFYWKVPNSVTIRDNLDIIKEIMIDSGRVKRINDTIFEITPFKKNSLTLTIYGGKNKYEKIFPVQKLANPRHLYIKGVPRNNRGSFEYLYTLNDLKKSSKIEAEVDGYIFKVKQFCLDFGYFDEADRLPDSPIFRSDSIGFDYLRELENYHDNLGVNAHGVVLISPDSTKTYVEHMQLGTLVKDSTSMIISRYGGYTKVHSDIRIKISGIPDSHDQKTIREIINELNSCLPTLKVKRVEFLPSLTINFDTISKPFNSKRRLSWFNDSWSQTWTNSNFFFPLLSKASVNINHNTYSQNERDSILWRAIAGSLFIYPRELETYDNSVIIGSNNITGLTYEDKLAIKTIFSRGIDKKIKLFYPIYPSDYRAYPSLNFIVILSINILIYFVLSELLNYSGLSRVIKNNLFRRCIYSFLIAQMVILTIWILKVDAFKNFTFLQNEIYFSSYSIVTGGLLFFADDLIDRFTLKWHRLRLSLNPILTAVSLLLAYQFIYLFIRGEILRFKTIDQYALMIGLSVIIVRFYQEYEHTKISKLIQGKEFEIIKQKELKNRAELNALHARINPHFLYNALNSIAALARVDSKRTENMALSLSKLFRFTLNRGENMISTIGQEIEMAELYLEIEKHRFAERLIYSIMADERVKGKTVPRLLIQPLVENSIKHGISKITGQGIIEIKVFEQGNDLIIEIHDNGPDFPEGLLSGYGLQNTYDKLSLVYKKPYEIKFVNSPDKYLQIKLKYNSDE